MAETTTVPRRDEVPVEYTWNLALMYADDAAWEREVAALEAMIPDMAALQGSVGSNADALLRILKLRDDVGVRMYQMYRYASHRQDSDSTDPAGQALAERAGSLVAKIGAATAFVEPEILAIPEETISAWLSEQPELGVYSYALRELMRQRAHVRSAEVEAILAQFYDVSRATGEIFEILTNADLEFPMIEDANGQQVKLSHARYGRFMESKDRRVRRDAFKGMFGAFGSIRNTLGTTLAAEVRSHV
ncbi:MAG TPA: oligoendopeptidase F, partial [Roseiflexaceae bacterium]|nr:oligoendopeptidase F [Roseiflexaceae bacterium]